MYSFAFDLKGLQRELIGADFRRVPQLLDEDFRLGVLQLAMREAADGFSSLSLRSHAAGKRTIYQVSNLGQELVLRKFSRNLQRLTGVRQSDRNTMIKSLVRLLEEGHDYRLYKLDIESFYESVDRNILLDSLLDDRGLPPTTLSVFRSFWPAP